MDNQRLFLYVGLALVLYLIWQTWKQEHAPVPPPRTPQAEQTIEGSDTPALQPADVADVPDDIPDSPEQTQQEQATGAADTPQPAAEELPGRRTVRVQTDVQLVEIDTRGGTIVRVDLPAYPQRAEAPDVPLRLLDYSDRVYVAQSGLLHVKTADASVDAGKLAPSHHAEYTAQQTEYRLADDAEEVQVPLTWKGDNGVTVTKLYTFHRGQYVVDLEHRVSNDGAEPWTARQYRQLRHGPVRDGDKQRFIYTFTGGAYYNEKYKKVDFEDMAEDPLAFEATTGWAAIIQHYFVTALVPEPDEPNHYYSKGVKGARGSPEYIIGLRSPAQTVAAGSTGSFTSKLFIGPKLQHDLQALAPGLELSVDYGYLTILSKPLFWLLEKIHSIVRNWGWSIILLTFIIKLAFYKLSETSYRSMAKMRNLQPRMVSLRERYAGDKQRMNQELMGLYKKEKINPLGGCLPIAVQIPVFIALYWVLLESVEMRQAPFILWLQDLSARDPYFVLPLIMGVSMFIQQKLNPAPLDPMQAKIMMLLPLVFTVFFAFFPSGLVLYWCVNNILSIAQQWTITKRLAGPSPAKA